MDSKSKHNPPALRYPQGVYLSPAAYRGIRSGLGGVCAVLRTLVEDAAREAHLPAPSRTHISLGGPRRNGLRLTPHACECIWAAFGSVHRVLATLRQDAEAHAPFRLYARLGRRGGAC